MSVVKVAKPVMMVGPFVTSAVAAGGVLLAGLVTRSIPVPGTAYFPPTWIIGIAAFVLALPRLLASWRTTLVLLSVWLVVEDLIRKYSGNDLRIYIAKDLIFLALVVALFLDREVRGVWIRATGKSRFALYALATWALLLSVPSGLQDPRIPVLGLRLDFFYVPLVIAGWLLARRRGELKRWFLWFSVLGAVVSLVGIVQATIGPSFLAPDRATPGLQHLVLFRGLPGSEAVYRPTATFVDPGRFAAYAVVSLAISIAAFHLWRGAARAVALACVVALAAGVWVSAGRAALLAGMALIAAGALAGPYGARRLAAGRVLVLVASAVVAFGLLGAVAPGLIGGRENFYAQTLLPTSPANEWEFRWRAYTRNTIVGLQLGRWYGQGTGEGALGKQYLYEGRESSSAGLYAVEGGYATVAQEWGAIGLLLWSIWTVVWIERQRRAVSRSRPSDVAAAGLVLLAWVVLFLIILFFAGFQVFQNYLSNAYFWLLSGVLFALPVAAGRDALDERLAVRGSA